MKRIENKTSPFAGKWTVLPYWGLVLLIVYLFGTLGGSRLREMIYFRGLIPHLILIASSFALGFLTYKYIQGKITQRNLDRISSVIENDKLLISFLKNEEAKADHTSAALNLLADIPDGPERGRIVALLRDAKQVGQDFALKRLEMFLDLEAQKSEDSFKTPQVLAWIVPMLGFLGTVWGISQSLSNFTGIMQDVDNISQIKTGLGTITSGLGVAFDTTLLGLFFAIIITGVTTYLQRRESLCLQELERCSLEVLKTVSAHESTLVGSKEERDTAAVIALNKGLERLTASLGNAQNMLVQPSQDMRTALGNLQAYANALVALAKESNTMTEQRRSLEAAARAITEIQRFSESLDRHADACRNLYEASQLLRQPKEFRLVEHYVGNSSSSQPPTVPFKCENCGHTAAVEKSKLPPNQKQVGIRCPNCRQKTIINVGASGYAN